ncbi:MAG: helix-turn-helix domain-containing protein [Candidatus Thermoplasmatota archaeon]
MLEATLRVHIPGCWATRIAQNGHVLRIVDRKIVKGSAMESLVEIGGRAGDPHWAQLSDMILSQPKVSDFRSLMTDAEHILGIVRCEDCLSCRTLVTSDCFVTSAVSREGAIEWTLRFDDKRKIAKLVGELQRARIPVDVARIASIRGKPMLTPRQSEVLRLALGMGYFDFPKRAGIEALAQRLGVSKSTVAETLHRAERKVLTTFVERNG